MSPIYLSKLLSMVSFPGSIRLKLWENIYHLWLFLGNRKSTIAWSGTIWPQFRLPSIHLNIVIGTPRSFPPLLLRVEPAHLRPRLCIWWRGCIYFFSHLIVSFIFDLALQNLEGEGFREYEVGVLLPGPGCAWSRSIWKSKLTSGSVDINRT